MSGLVSGLFSWQNFLIDIIYSLVLAGVFRAMVWLFNVPLRGRRREMVYWIVVPAFVLIVGLFVTVLSQARDPQMKRPMLKGEIDWAIIGRRSSSRATTITVVASIRNLGTPSIVEGWSLEVILPSGRAFATERIYVPETLTLHREDDSPITFSGEDALYHKTETTPIATGGRQRGVLLFLLHDVDQSSVLHPDTKLVLKYQDVLGTQYTAERLARGIQREVPYFPGLRVPQ